jgi:8-oxo-dGTP diphosphatase
MSMTVLTNCYRAERRGENMGLVVVAAALVDADRRILMQRRPPGKAHAGLWEFPGGKVEAGERVREALTRELAEELGIAVDAAAVTPVAFAAEPLADGELLLLLFLCRQWRGEPVAHEASELAWLAPDALLRLSMPPADVALARQIAALV